MALMQNTNWKKAFYVSWTSCSCGLGTGYFLGQFYPDIWFFWTRLQAEGGTKKFGNHWPKVMIFLCSPNNKRQAFSVWTIHEGYFDIKRIAVWDFDNFFNSCFQLFIFFPQNQNKLKAQLKVAIFPIKITKPNIELGVQGRRLVPGHVPVT